MGKLLGRYDPHQPVQMTESEIYSQQQRTPAPTAASYVTMSSLLRQLLLIHFRSVEDEYVKKTNVKLKERSKSSHQQQIETK